MNYRDSLVHRCPICWARAHEITGEEIRCGTCGALLYTRGRRCGPDTALVTSRLNEVKPDPWKAVPEPTDNQSGSLETASEPVSTEAQIGGEQSSARARGIHLYY